MINKYALLTILVTSNIFAQDLQICLPDTDLNPSQRFSVEIIQTDRGDYKVVNDRGTGLQWSYCLVGQQLGADQNSCEGQPTVNNQHFLDILQSENLSLDAPNKSWRLPNVKELLSIYNDRCVPAVYPNFHYSFGMSDAEINQLVNMVIDRRLPADEKERLRAEIARAKTYKGLNLLSDSSSSPDGDTYYTVTFNGISSPIIGGNNLGMLRLVREIPAVR
ncbi:DUF1566 domain-containing protein [Vibrio mimicus]|uniref:Lcl domain-containing protein n=1 Tax=Vibrio mimicus TaxID=674 RepID=UPI002F926C3B